MGTLGDHSFEKGEWAVIEAHWPGQHPTPIGILLRNPLRDQLLVRLRPLWWATLPNREEAELWSELGHELEQQADERGAAAVLSWLEETASHALQISPRQEIVLTNPTLALEELYRQYVGAVVPASHGMSRLHLFRDAVRRLFAGSAIQHGSGRRWRQATVAATLLATAAWVGLEDRRTGMASTFVAVKAPELRYSPELPLGTGAHYQPVLWNLEAQEPKPRPTHRPHRPRQALIARPHKPFRLDPGIVRPQVMQLAQVHVLAPALAVELHPAVWIPHTLDALPQPPRYRARHNKVVRTLALLSVPFRLLAK